jgi:acyl-CoA dehydrogenase family protein 9
MNEAIAYARQREQFGKPIASFEMIKRKIAIAAAECYAADAAWMLTAHMVDRGGVDFSLETAICKVFGSEMAYRAANEALQIAGGIGYSKEFPYERSVRDSRIMMIFEGTNEILRALVALMGLQQPGERLKALGRALQDPIHEFGAIGGYLAGRAKSTLNKPDFTRVHEALAEEAELVAGQVHELARGVERALRRHGKAIIERQYVQERLANAAADLFLATATLSRISAEIERAGGDLAAVSNELDCARVFVHMAYRRTRRSLRGLRANQDARLDTIAARAVETGDLAPPAPTGR